MARLATIDLDWLDSEIEKYRKIEEDTLPQYMLVKLRGRFNLEALNMVRSKCTPIEENKEVILPKTCLNQWEDKKYCSNEGMCKMCQINN